MNCSQLIVLFLGSLILIGCNPTSSSEPSGSNAAEEDGSAWPFEGDYYDTNYNDKPPVSFMAGQYYGSILSNPGGDMNGSGKYTVRETGSGTWELDFEYDDGGRSTVVYIRKDGDDILVREASAGGEIRLRKK